MIRSITTLTLCLAAVTAQGALLGRAALTPGGTDYQAYYDNALDITWLADASFAQTSGFDSDGLLLWGDAQAWMADLSTAAHLGATNWRQPIVRPVDGSSFDLSFSFNGSTDIGHNISASGSAFPGSTGSELAHLFYTTLGNISPFNVGGVFVGCPNPGPLLCLDNTGPFSNVQVSYMTGTDDPVNANSFLAFNFYNGAQYSTGTKNFLGYAWAVRDGDIALVPAPAAVWLFGSALGVMGWMRRKAL